ncbi:MAG: hypothetical protein V6Z81_10330 [Parvularculales bacterium]
MFNEKAVPSAGDGFPFQAYVKPCSNNIKDCHPEKGEIEIKCRAPLYPELLYIEWLIFHAVNIPSFFLNCDDKFHSLSILKMGQT